MSRKRRVLLTAVMFAAPLMWVTYLGVSRKYQDWGNIIAMTTIAGVVGSLGGAFMGWLFLPWKKKS